MGYGSVTTNDSLQTNISKLTGFLYLVAYDSVYDSRRDVIEGEKICGIIKVFVASSTDYVFLRFYNGINENNLRTYEVSQSEWETMKAFELFPILYPYDEELSHMHATTFESEIYERATYKVNFHDY